MSIQPAVIAVPRSRNKKTGPVAATYVTQKTCPGSCPFLDSGCYAEHGNNGLHTRRLNSSPITDPIEIAKTEAAMIDKLNADLDLRVHVVGDCASTGAANIVGGAMARYDSRSQNESQAWTYTHGWREIPHGDWQGANVLASCETLNQVKLAQEREYATCIVRDSHPSTRVYKQQGLKILPCPEETRGIKCVDCRLCMRTDSLRSLGLTIRFSPHGAGVRKARQALTSPQRPL